MFCDPEASTQGSREGRQPAEQTEEASPHRPPVTPEMKVSRTKDATCSTMGRVKS